MVKNIVKRNDKYRTTFFKKNKGIFGIYICYVCNKPMTRKNTQVDHVMPISKLGGTNLGYNLMPICGKCNRKKSNKVNHLVLKGYSRKLIGTIISTPFKIAFSLFGAFRTLSWKLQLTLIFIAGFVLYSQYG